MSPPSARRSRITYACAVARAPPGGVSPHNRSTRSSTDTVLLACNNRVANTTRTLARRDHDPPIPAKELQLSRHAEVQPIPHRTPQRQRKVYGPSRPPSNVHTTAQHQTTTGDFNDQNQKDHRGPRPRHRRAPHPRKRR